MITDGLGFDDDIFYESRLWEHGIQGQKWGVRKQKEKPDTPSPEEKSSEPGRRATRDEVKQALKFEGGSPSGSEVQASLNLAIERLSTVGIDQKLLSDYPLLGGMKEVPGEGLQSQGYPGWKGTVVGKYDRNYPTIRLNREHVLPGTVLHELGHHIDSAFSPGRKRTSELSQEMQGEFKNTKGLSSQGKDPSVKIPSKYALVNEGEWWAECFRLYYESDTTQAHLKEAAPKTFKILDKVLQGKKEEGEGK